MKKDEFLIKLRENLIDRGVSEEIADKETEAVRVYLSKSNMDEVDISIETMADGIVSVLVDGSDVPLTIPVAVPEEPEAESVSDEFSAAIAHINGEGTPAEAVENTAEEEDPEQVPADIPVFVDPEAEVGDNEEDGEIDPDFLLVLEEELIATEPTEESTEVTTEEQSAPEAEGETASFEASSDETLMHEDLTPITQEQEPVPEQSPEIVEETPENPVEELEAVFSDEPSSQPQPEPDPAGAAPVHIDDEEEAEIEEFIPLDKKRRMKNNSPKTLSKTNGTGKKPTARSGANDWLYILLLVVTIPLAIALVLVAVVLYLGFWVVLALAMIGCIAALIVFVTVGTIVSLVGIVYGVVQLITGMIPIGLFEIGLGIVVGSVVMCIGILVYNFAVRFIPFGMKLLAKLFRMGFRALKSGYQSLKGAIDSL